MRPHRWQPTRLPLSLGFSRQEYWSGLPFPSPMHESEKWKWSRSVVSDPQWPHGLQAPASMGFSRQEYWSGKTLLYQLEIYKCGRGRSWEWAFSFKDLPQVRSFSRTTGANSAILGPSGQSGDVLFSDTSTKWVHLKPLGPTCFQPRPWLWQKRPAGLTHSASFVALPLF